MFSQLDNPEFVIVDARQSAAFNGWKLHNEDRHGHIEGAVSFPATWPGFFSQSECKEILLAKSITKDKKIIVYGYDIEQSVKLAQALGVLNYKHLFIYEAGIIEWALDHSLPMQFLKNYEKLVHSEWVWDLINGDTFEKDFMIYQISSNDNAYDVGHIPGAVNLNINLLENPEDWNRFSDKKIVDTLSKKGLKNDLTCVLYSENMTLATRAAAILMNIGIQDIRILDGGYHAWQAAGYEIEEGTAVKKPDKSLMPIETEPREFIIDIDEIKKLSADSAVALLDIRSRDEYQGLISGYAYIDQKGRIPGAKWGRGGIGLHQMGAYRNIDHTMRAFTEIASFWRKEGVTADKHIVFYCGTGWRASEAYFYAHLMGWEHISIYDGGWLEWSADSNNLIECENNET